MADTTEKKTYLVNVESNLNKYAADAAKAADEVDRLTIENVKLKGSTTASKEEIEKSNSALRNAQKEYTEAKKLVDLQTQANNSNINSRKQLNAIVTLEQRRLGALANTYTINSKGVRELSQDYINQVKRLKEAKDAVIGYDKAQADGRSSVGLYSEAINSSLAGLQSMPGATGLAAGGVQRLSLAFKALLANPVVLVIAAIVGAVKILIEVFKKFDPIIDRIQKAVSGLTGVFTLLKESVIGLVTGQKTLKETFEGLGTSIRDAYDEGVKLKGLQQELDDMNWLLIVSEARKKRQIDELLIQARDRTKTEEERIELIDKALAIEKELYNERKDVADRERLIAEDAIIRGRNLTEEQIAQLRSVGVAYAIKLKDTKAVTDEEITNLANAVASQERILNESVMIREKAIVRQNKLIEDAELEREKALAKMDTAKKQLTKELDDYKKFIAAKKEEDIKAAEDKRKREIDQAEWERNRQLTNQENLLSIRELNNEYQVNIERARLEIQRKDEVDNARKTGADINIINAKYAASQKQIDEIEAQTKLQLYSGFAANLAQIFGEQTAIGKAAAIAQTTIATYEAATQSYKALSGIPVVGPALGVAAAAAAVAAGLANVKKIVAVKSGLPGENSIAAPTTISGNVVRAIAPQANILNQPQLTQAQLNAVPNVNTLTAKDIANEIRKLPAPIVSVEAYENVARAKTKVEIRANI